jgi:hypothetical protein
MLFGKGPALASHISRSFLLVSPLALFAEMAVALFILLKGMKALSFSHISVYKFV